MYAANSPNRILNHHTCQHGGRVFPALIYVNLGVIQQIIVGLARNSIFEIAQQASLNVRFQPRQYRS